VGIAGFDDALRYLNGRTNIERMRPSRVDRALFKLDRMRALLGALEDPQRDVRCVHVAGSKGKGSVVEMTAASLMGCGYAVGVYTSPHLADVRERVRINHRPISEPEFAAQMDEVARAAASVEAAHGEATYFEILTAMALCHFRDNAVDLAVIETGLGGRLDATNVVEPMVTVVTHIQREHTAVLGTELGQIAREKAGIFKPGVRALTGRQPEPVLAALREEAEKRNAPLSVLGEDVDFTWRVEATPELGSHVRVCVSAQGTAYEHLAVPLPGEHQAANCGLALAVLAALGEWGFEAPEKEAAAGLAGTARNGRMELVWENPRIMIDGAHNPESVGALMRAVGPSVGYDSMVVVFACAADKDIDGMLRELASGADKVIFTRPTDVPRAADPTELMRRFNAFSPRLAQVQPTVKEAINAAHGAVGPGDLICVTGSFYVAGEAKRLLERVAQKAGA